MTSPRGARSTTSGRVYTWAPTGEQFPSVTSAIGVLDKPALKSWAAKMTAEYAFDNHTAWSGLARSAAVDLLKRESLRVTSHAMEIGTAVHAAAEAHSLGRPVAQPSPEVAPFMQQFRRFLSDFEPSFLEVEATLYSRTEGYAGTTDFIAEIGGQVVIGDLKSGSGIYPEVALQLAAYRYADFIGRPDDTEAPLPVIEGAVALHLRPDAYRLIPVKADMEAFMAFLDCLSLLKWKTGGERHAIGDPLTPEVAA